MTRNIIISIIAILALCYNTSVKAVPKHEVRAVWLTTIGGLDWPHSYAQSGAAITRQKQEFIQILEKYQRANINTVLLQTRVRATTIFPSDDEPWDGCLSGVPGKSPGYDALEFAIEECHKRGMELHAWVVTIPVGKWNGAGCRNLRQRYPNLVIKIGEDGYMSPSDSRTGDYLARYCANLTRRYDLDGIHLDYIRYPETWKKLPPAAQGRANITNIVRKIHKAVKAEKPWVKLSCSPVGKHDDLKQYWSHGWNARTAVLQDAALWMKEGLMDAEFPMMYFKGNNFYPFAIDWKEKSYGKTMCPGLGIYFLSPKEKNWALQDITRELYVLRDNGMGHCFFRSKFLTDDIKGLYTFLCNEFNRYPAFTDPLAHNGKPAPLAPENIEVQALPGALKVSWKDGLDRSGGPYLSYAVYTSRSYPVDCSRAENIIAMKVRGNELKVPNMQPSDGFYFAVTAIDRYGNESEPRQMKITSVPPSDVRPGWYWVSHPLGDSSDDYYRRHPYTKPVDKKSKKKKSKKK